MTRSPLATVGCLLVATAWGQGGLRQNDPSPAPRCRYRHALEAPADAYHRVELPREALVLDPYRLARRDPGYPEDLRLYAATAAGDTAEVPYVYEGERRAAVAKTYLGVLNRGRVNAGAYRYTVDVPGARRVSAFELELSNRNFDGRVRVEGANRLGDFQEVVAGLRIVGLVNEGTAFEYARVRLPEAARYRYYRLTITGIDSLDLRRVATYAPPVGERPGRVYPTRLALSTPTRDGRATEAQVYLEHETLVDRVAVHVADTVPFARPTQLTTRPRARDSAPLSYRDRPTGHATATLTQADTVIHVAPSVARVITLKIKDGDDAPLQLASVTVEGPRRFLVARFPVGVTSAWMTYGCERRGAPAYDLARLPEQIPAALAPLGVGEAEVRDVGAEEVPPDWSQIALWTALVLAGVVIAVVGVRLLGSPA